jgi:uncharacterized membrane protein
LSKSFLYLIITISGSVGVYWLWAFKLGLNENAGLLVSTLAAIILASFFYRLRNR